MAMGGHGVDPGGMGGCDDDKDLPRGGILLEESGCQHQFPNEGSVWAHWDSALPCCLNTCPAEVSVIRQIISVNRSTASSDCGCCALHTCYPLRCFVSLIKR